MVGCADCFNNDFVMKKRHIRALAVSAAALALASCGGNASAPGMAAASISVDSLMSVAEASVGDTIVVRGFVRHTCKHGGRRCFVSNAGRDSQVRVEAGEAIGSFDKGLIGAEVAVRGVVRENRVSADEIREAIRATEERKASGEAAEHCESALGVLNQRMEKAGQDGRGYYSDFYVDGLEFEKIETKS